MATVRAAYNLMRTGKTEDVSNVVGNIFLESILLDSTTFPMNNSWQAQERIQRLAIHFFTSTSSNSIWVEAISRGIISFPLSEGWADRLFQTHIVPVRTRVQYSMYLACHLIFAGFTAFFADYPTVPKGQSRVRLALHSCNTEEQVDALIAAICEWVKEMMAIEDGEIGQKIPTAARKVLASVENGDGV